MTEQNEFSRTHRLLLVTLLAALTGCGVEGSLTTERNVDGDGGVIADRLTATGQAEETGDGRDADPAPDHLGPHGNRPPVIRVFTAEPAHLSARETVVLHVDATDPDGDALAYGWTTPRSSPVVGDGSTIRWTSGAASGTWTMEVEVTDTHGATAAASLDVFVYGNEYRFVAPTGNDEGPGTLSQPWRTLAHAGAAAVAGQTVLIREGTYNERLRPANSGSVGAFLTFAAFPGETATLDGSGIPVDPFGGVVQLEAKAYIRIAGLRVIHSSGAGIFAKGACQHLIIESNSTYDTVSSGIGVWGTESQRAMEIAVVGNRVELACNDGGQECITLARVEHFEILDNEVLNGGPGTNGGEGIDAKDGVRHGEIAENHVHHLPRRLGIYVDAARHESFDIRVHDNLVHDVGSAGIRASSEFGGLLHDVEISSNLVHDVRSGGVEIGWGNRLGRAHPLRDIFVFGNTASDCGAGFVIGGLGGLNEEGFFRFATFDNVFIFSNISDGSRKGVAVEGLMDYDPAHPPPADLDPRPRLTGVQIFNNTIYGRGSDPVIWGGGINLAKLRVTDQLVVRNNIVSHSDDFEIRSANVAGLVIADHNFLAANGDPLYVEPARGDYHLSTGSPAIDAAIPVVLAGDRGAIDYDGVARPRGAAWDIGAFERAVDACPGSAPSATCPLGGAGE